MAGPAYMNPDTYHNITLNPSRSEPERELRQVYLTNAVEPIEVAIFLAHRRALTMQNFSLTLGDDTRDARAFLNSDIFEPLFSADVVVKRAQIATYLAAYEEAKAAKAAVASQREKIRHDTGAKPIAVPPDKKAAAKAEYRATTHHTYFKLLPSNTPHDKLWDDADTRLFRNGYMPYYPIFEIRSSDEVVHTQDSTKEGKSDTSRYIEITDKIILATYVESIEDVLRRQMTFFILCTFLNQLPFERGLEFRDAFIEWNT